MYTAAIICIALAFFFDACFSAIFWTFAIAGVFIFINCRDFKMKSSINPLKIRRTKPMTDEKQDKCLLDVSLRDVPDLTPRMVFYAPFKRFMQDEPKVLLAIAATTIVVYMLASKAGVGGQVHHYYGSAAQPVAPVATVVEANRRCCRNGEAVRIARLEGKIDGLLSRR